MLNYIWAAMIVIGVLWAAVCGNMSAVTQGLLDAAADAVSLCITMLGVISLWTGILKIGERAGMVERLTRKMGPVLKFLFPDLPENHPAGRYIAANMIANILGLGWAATPAGLQAMQELAKLEEERRNPAYLQEGTESIVPENVREADRGKGAAIGGKERVLKNHARAASSEMCTFLILNISSLQLIPVNMIAYRAQYGSANPAAIVGPAIAATAASTLAAAVFCKVMDRSRKV